MFVRQNYTSGGTTTDLAFLNLSAATVLTVSGSTVSVSFTAGGGTDTVFTAADNAAAKAALAALVKNQPDWVVSSSGAVAINTNTISKVSIRDMFGTWAVEVSTPTSVTVESGLASKAAAVAAIEAMLGKRFIYTP